MMKATAQAIKFAVVAISNQYTFNLLVNIMFSFVLVDVIANTYIIAGNGQQCNF